MRSYLVEYLDEEAVRHGCQTLIGNTVISTCRFEACIDDFIHRGVDGIFCAVHPHLSGDRRLLMERCPNTVFYEDPQVNAGTFVAIDQVAAGRIAVRHLVEQGRRRIGFALTDPLNPRLEDRVSGYRAELASQGLRTDKEHVFDGEPGCTAPLHPKERLVVWHTPTEVLDAIIDRLVVQKHVDAIVAHDDFLAAALLRQLRKRCISVPSEVAVIGYLNHYLCDHVDPPLTSVDLQHHVAARTMVTILEDVASRPRGEPPAAVPPGRRAISIAPMLVVRQST